MPARLRRAAGETWALRALGERAAEARFHRIASGLEAVGAPAPVLELARRAPVDEARHFVLCVDAAERFGVAVPDAPIEIPWTAVGLPDRQQLLHEVVAMCCVTETLSVGFLIEMQRRTLDPSLHAVVHEILGDEVGHSRLGWGHLAFERSRMDVSFLGACLPGVLAGTVGEVLFSDPDPDDPALSLGHVGVLDRVTRRVAFSSCMRDVVFPGLDQLGVDTTEGRRWLDARSDASRPSSPSR